MITSSTNIIANTNINIMISSNANTHTHIHMIIIIIIDTNKPLEAIKKPTEKTEKHSKAANENKLKPLANYSVHCMRTIAFLCCWYSKQWTLQAKTARSGL